jgi:hypothetical protein
MKIPDEYIRANNTPGLDPLNNRELLILKPKNSAKSETLGLRGKTEEEESGDGRCGQKRFWLFRFGDKVCA